MTIPYLHCGQTKLLLQVKKDLERHEGFREFAYPDPLSKLYKAHPELRKKWGFYPVQDLLPPDTDWEDGSPWTVGHGFTEGTTQYSRMTRTQSERRLEGKILAMDSLLNDRYFPSWWKDASFVTKTILINMAFNMGIGGLLGFKNTLRYIKERNYKQAAANMRKSLWFKQVGSRAVELSRRMETQEIPDIYKAPETI